MDIGGLDVSSGGPSSDSESESVPDTKSDPVSNDSYFSCKEKTGSIAQLDDYLVSIITLYR